MSAYRTNDKPEFIENSLQKQRYIDLLAYE